MGRPLTRELRAVAATETFQTIPTWNVILVWRNHTNATKQLQDAVSLTPLWTQLDISTDTSEPPCSLIYYRHTDFRLRSNAIMGLAQAEQFALFTCPRRELKDVTRSNGLELWEFLRKPELTRPDLKLTVNFTELLNPNEQPGDHGIEQDSLKVYLSPTKSIGGIHLNEATRLFPGTNLVGVPEFTVQQFIRTPHWSTLGFFDTYDTVLTARMAYTTPDPLAAVTPDYPTGPKVATFRIASIPVIGEWTVKQEYRTKSTLSGFAEVGGLGSFLSIFLVILFGNTLLGTVYRTKPLTPFGLVHHLGKPRESVFRSSEDHYGALRSDLQLLKDNPGLLKFMLDTLIDLDVIAEEPPTLKKGGDIEQVGGPLAGPEGEEADRREQNRLQMSPSGSSIPPGTQEKQQIREDSDGQSAT
ncbi:hypothetical protein EST38_g11240 [Candolleomyces aberdarensis]|uniref:Uncharacterized protein n=1 Tax=Candolleomyces aberdarensis TaxID=2316362 RepID=A0A4Q2D5B8_9AGAR|nr:hypothetical protein EST38_g11240 [Candolleomyces aberdarensis]